MLPYIVEPVKISPLEIAREIRQNAYCPKVDFHCRVISRTVKRLFLIFCKIKWSEKMYGRLASVEKVWA